MPELPDVENFRRYLNATTLGRGIAAVHATAPDMLEDMSPRALRTRLTHRRFVQTRRHGKLLFAGLDRGGWLVLHFGMTGSLKHYTDPQATPPHARLLIDFTDGSHLAL